MRQICRTNWIWSLVFLIFASCSSASVREPEVIPAVDPLCTRNVESAVLELQRGINMLRNSRNNQGIITDRDLSDVAHNHVLTLAASGSIGHMDNVGHTPIERLEQSGLRRRFVAENVARFEDTAYPGRTVLRYWWERNQEGENMIHSRYRRMGAAFAARDGFCYAVLILTD
ncbi:MAG: hypothetical protein KDK30_08330 [Leptospiraceae bacterium]|nr:hypothetical protein [Leptospiraceae bacterium]MCB1317105.1 hypothetical protein [Leptospiraceae bacterium]MCB1320012.1 hypothetical protein [Leptospiraceae bacterium]